MTAPSPTKAFARQQPAVKSGPWSAEEVSVLRARWAEGVVVPEICRELGRKYYSVLDKAHKEGCLARPRGAAARINPPRQRQRQSFVLPTRAVAPTAGPGKSASVNERVAAILAWQRATLDSLAALGRDLDDLLAEHAQ